MSPDNGVPVIRIHDEGDGRTVKNADSRRTVPLHPARWTAFEVIELGVPLPTLTGALDARFRSQDPEPFANKLLSMMRHEFGGHAVKTTAK